jgi:hypothetical protein
MRTLPASELLAVWERGADRTPGERALVLLAGACPETAADELAGLSIGRRDALLLELRERTFGPDLVSVASCPACCERLETSLRTADLFAEPEAEAAGPLELISGGWRVRFRVPNSLDLAAMASLGCADEASGRALLLVRCVLAADHGGRPAAAAELPAEVVAALGEQMERSDPQADVRIVLGCPACGHRWESVFDILSFFWSELAAWAEHTLREVHLLASAYGWREPDVLALGLPRRQAYLRMVAE